MIRQLQALVVLVVLIFPVSSLASDLQISESTIDYGNIKEGPPVLKKIVLTNSGAQPLIIANAAAS